MASNDIGAFLLPVRANARVDRLSDGQRRALLQNRVQGLALLHAAWTKHARNVDALLRAGISPAATSHDGVTALHVAATNGFETIAQRLLGADASLARRSDQRGCLPLHLAAANGHTDIVDRLLRNEGDSGLNCTNHGGEVPLFVAARAGHDTVVARLLQANAKTKTITTDGSTLLHAAALGGNTIVLSQLSQFFTSVDLGQTPLHVAAKGGQDAAVQYLLEVHANVFARTEDGATSLMLAASATIAAALRGAEANARAWTVV
ncbi:hypothetical protein SDRG_12194 [Saprolegnia diclina VS20]|uniref:Uncharacterized protein n=1 Tax=Saprolegnia diclina (strain VS20) TaxID=1156394 RepID=T0Q6A0_SAPDV|nr:hypothetical protein SDRG_12194 [Saprolegnia diclina VS20]EQC30136.1 hypothetical protein SDRG_12194 [Saprolegnia diclina VS20]|eukprot:XP_008616479.1 hypothetical protein SDRG_12194 [Saprolegnia diclina VS20]